MVGIGRAKDIVMRSRRITGREAGNWGIATVCIRDGELEAAADALVDELRAVAPLAQRTAKKLLTSGRRIFAEDDARVSAVVLCSACGAAIEHRQPAQDIYRLDQLLVARRAHVLRRDGRSFFRGRGRGRTGRRIGWQLAAGLVEGRLHLIAYALGVAASGMTFADGLVPRLLGQGNMQGLLFTCIGVPEYRSKPGGPLATPAPSRW